MKFDDTVVPATLPPSPITPQNVMSGAESEALRAVLATHGVRILPYPFASALSIVSDVDSSRRHRYEGYIGEIVDDLGLDFGDSIWLSWFKMPRGNKKIVAMGFGFFTPSLAITGNEDEELFANTRTFNENIIEFHKGNVDHFHAFFARGIRVVPLKAFHADETGQIKVEVSGVQGAGLWSCSEISVLAVCIVGAPHATLDVARVSVAERGAPSGLYEPAAYDGPPDDRPYRLFSWAAAADDGASAPPLDRVESITIDFHRPEHAASVERVFLLSVHSDLLFERLKWLQSKYNVDMNLITEHSRFHFSAANKTDGMDAQLKRQYERAGQLLEGYNGTLIDDGGQLVFSTHCDLPHSFGRVFPELSRDLEYRFVNPIASMKASGWDPFEVVTPSPTRTGGGIYYARRTRRNAVDPAPGQFFDHLISAQDTFTKRLSLILEDMTRQPGLFWPLYTHLGSWELPYENRGVVDALGTPVPVPYFAVEPMRDLQDRAFNITGTVDRASRVWVSRATTHYDYALMLRSVAEHVERPDGNTVLINSWPDHVLGKMMPRSPAQLYGLTFYVDDPARAEVLLDGAPVDFLFRNAPDESGRASVSIAACDLHYTVFDQLDPARNHPTGREPPTDRPEAGASWRWRPREGDERSFGRLTLTPSQAGMGLARTVGSIRFPLCGWTATGAQAVSLLVRATSGARFGLLFETQTGGRFLIGDAAVETFGCAPANASYRHADLAVQTGEWRRITIPFHDLTWAPRSKTGGPMPNHPLEAMTLLATGDPGAEVDFADVAFLRPRAVVQTDGVERRYCLGGHVQGFSGGDIVHAVRLDSDDPSARETAVDQRGFFCFVGVAVGIYEVWARIGDATVHDRRGAIVEVNGDTVTLVLESSAS